MDSALDQVFSRSDSGVALAWRLLDLDLEGSDVVLSVTVPNEVGFLTPSPDVVLTYSLSGGGLTLSGDTVSWLPPGSPPLYDVNFYTLTRLLTGGEDRLLASGRLLASDEPLDPPAVVVAVPGPQGPVGESAYQAAGGDARWGSEGAWLSSLVRAPNDYALAVSSAGQTLFQLSPEPAALSTLVLSVNGVSYRAPVQLSASGSSLTWSGEFELSPSDDVRVSYF